MFFRWFNDLRCRCASWLLDSSLPKNVFLAQRISPGTTSLIRHRIRRPPPLPLPTISHLIYHQPTVDKGCVVNSLRTIDDQIPEQDEVLFLDIGGSMGPSALDYLKPREWYQYASCLASKPEQQSYTFGLNATMSGLRGDYWVVWRTDYVYPESLYEDYSCSLEAGAHFACPESVLVGFQEADSSFISEHAKRLRPYDNTFWSEHGRRVSLYATQDPALFAINRKLWSRVEGLNHALWGYGWQFAEFAARLRVVCKPSLLEYFKCSPPFHQTHAGSLMHQPEEKAQEAKTGERRFAEFLGGDHAYRIYRMKQILDQAKSE